MSDENTNPSIIVPIAVVVGSAIFYIGLAKGVDKIKSIRENRAETRRKVKKVKS